LTLSLTLSLKGYVEDIRNLDLSKEDIDDMLGGNAARILGIGSAKWVKN
jgi:predicted TIM-barrel fold metal-dependent hydrolase